MCIVVVCVSCARNVGAGDVGFTVFQSQHQDFAAVVQETLELLLHDGANNIKVVETTRHCLSVAFFFDLTCLDVGGFDIFEARADGQAKSRQHAFRGDFTGVIKDESDGAAWIGVL